MPTTGFMKNVNGASSAMPIVAVSPGSAPMMMPMIVPTAVAKSTSGCRTWRIAPPTASSIT